MTNDELKERISGIIDELLVEYDKNTIIDRVVKIIFEALELDNQIHTEYLDSFCDLYLNYARKNVNANGFFGAYLIDQTASNEWVNQHLRWKTTLSMIPHVTTNLINETIDTITSLAATENDISTSTKICLKLLDIYYKVDKDSGGIKERSSELREIKRKTSTRLDDLDIANKYLENMETKSE